jgi:hypothetical protein
MFVEREVTHQRPFRIGAVVSTRIPQDRDRALIGDIHIATGIMDRHTEREVIPGSERGA